MTILDSRTRALRRGNSAAACILLTAVLASGSACGPETGRSRTGELAPECAAGEGPADALCTTITVLENRQAGGGRTIDLNVVIFPALSREPRRDPLFVLTGGPGSGAASLAEDMMVIFDDVQQERDIVFVDQRGTGKSNPLPCRSDNPTLEDFSRNEQRAGKFQECLASYDADPRFYTTPIAMDDLEQVRQELGYERINLWGGSYGTRAAQVYVRRHGEHVRSMVLDGVAPMGMILPRHFAEDGQRALDLLISACEIDVPCAERFPGVRRKLELILDDLERNPRTVRLRHPRTGEPEDVVVYRKTIAGALRGALYSPKVSSLIPLLVEQAYEGDFQSFFALISLNEPVNEQVSQGMFFSVICAEDVPWLGNRADDRLTEGTFLGGHLPETWARVCDDWPRGEIPPDYHEPVVSDVPTLVLSGEFDPVTPPRWGKEVSRHLSRAEHVVVPGAGHGVSAVGCVPDLIKEFLDAASAEDLEFECLNKLHRPPFFGTRTGSAELR